MNAEIISVTDFQIIFFVCLKCDLLTATHFLISKVIELFVSETMQHALHFSQTVNTLTKRW